MEVFSHLPVWYKTKFGWHMASHDVFITITSQNSHLYIIINIMEMIFAHFCQFHPGSNNTFIKTDVMNTDIHLYISTIYSFDKKGMSVLLKHAYTVVSAFYMIQRIIYLLTIQNMSHEIYQQVLLCLTFLWPGHQFWVNSCGGNPQVTSGTKASDVELWSFFYLRLNKRLRKQLRWWFEKPLHLLWRHCNKTRIYLCDLRRQPMWFQGDYHCKNFNLKLFPLNITLWYHMNDKLLLLI